jgi:hypothetical protein
VSSEVFKDGIVVQLLLSTLAVARAVAEELAAERRQSGGLFTFYQAVVDEELFAWRV